MRSNLPLSVSKLTEFITNQQAYAIMRLELRSSLDGIAVSERDSVIYAIYVNTCTEAVWTKQLSIEETEELVRYIFIDEYSKSNNKPLLPLTVRHHTIAHNLRIEQDENWKYVAELSLDSLKAGNPSLADIIEERSINWDAGRLNNLSNNVIDHKSKSNHASLKHSLNCPYCAIKLQIDQVFSKTEVRCPSCTQSFNVQP